ncbi:MAG: hypothetical protein IKN09_03855 [Clostridia bacterium]|nr:hypothetical protein [Clostridia bacterium]MBR4261600.1 hypothetical protein [Clostridia bacterium]
MNMLSYASLERIENGFAVCEVEQVSVFDSTVGDFSKECYMADIPLALFEESYVQPVEGHVYSVEHDGKNVTKVVRYEESETQRRINWLQSIGKTLATY